MMANFLSIDYLFSVYLAANLFREPGHGRIIKY